ncbi:MAG: ABC transporter substrate-binding protein [Prevotella sp.]
MKKILIYGIAALLMSACGQTYEEKQRMTRAERQRLAREDSLALKMAVMPTLDGMPLYLAKTRGWFDSLNVDVRLKVRNAQMDCDTALVGGSVEGAVTDVKRMERMVAQGTPLDSAGQTNAYWQLIANRTVRVKNVSQLGDKMVAMTRYSATDYLTDKALEGVKTTSMVFRIQINDVLIRLGMLINNEMDALWLTEPQATTARLYKHIVLKDSRKMGEPLGRVVFTRKAMSDERRRQQIAAMVQGYNRACDSLNQYGLKNYADIVATCCHADAKTLQALPKMTFPHIAVPKWEKKTAKPKK